MRHSLPHFLLSLHPKNNNDEKISTTYRIDISHIYDCCYDSLGPAQIQPPTSVD